MDSVSKITRREILAGFGSVAGIQCVIPQARRAHGNSATAGYRFFHAKEATFVEAACERLIPADHAGPGAGTLRVAAYIDHQLAEPWGAAQRLYRGGTWQPGTSLAPSMPPIDPATLFRTALAVITAQEASFGERTSRAQTAYLRELEAGTVNLGAVQSSVFFALLLTMTVEGYFSHSIHAATRDRVAWRLRGFAGAHADVPRRDDDSRGIA